MTVSLQDTTSPKKDPWNVLEIPVEACEDEIRKAYLRKLKAFPPDRFPERFEEIRDAYAVLKDPRSRVQLMLFLVDPAKPLTTLLDKDRQKRKFLGPGPWLKALKE
jgi:DnaJ-domain-containing protein 1